MKVPIVLLIVSMMVVMNSCGPNNRSGMEPLNPEDELSQCGSFSEEGTGRSIDIDDDTHFKISSDDKSKGVTLKGTWKIDDATRLVTFDFGSGDPLKLTFFATTDGAHCILLPEGPAAESLAHGWYGAQERDDDTSDRSDP